MQTIRPQGDVYHDVAVGLGCRVLVGGGSDGCVAVENGVGVTRITGFGVGDGCFGPLVGVGASAEPIGPQVGSAVIATSCA